MGARNPVLIDCAAFYALRNAHIMRAQIPAEFDRRYCVGAGKTTIALPEPSADTSNAVEPGDNRTFRPAKNGRAGVTLALVQNSSSDCFL
jgi:hypothetical protein